MPARALLHLAPRSVQVMELPTPRPAAGEVHVTTAREFFAVLGAVL